MSKKILVTGGAGYIGSHMVRFLLEKGHAVVVFDNFSSSKPAVIERLKKFGSFTFVEGDLRKKEDLIKLFEQEKDIDTVFHFAALISVSESVKNPKLYFENNVEGSKNLLEISKENQIDKFIFSSTCAVYGETQYVPVDEKHPVGPVNPYGQTKLEMERLLEDYGKKHGIKYVIFRYFNVCGSVKDGQLGYDKNPSEHLTPNAVKGALGISKFELTYAKVDTPDGSPIRDFIDINDLTSAHYKAYEYLVNNKNSEIINLGTGRGYSVEEIVAKVEEITGNKIERIRGSEREGEYAEIYANYTKAKKLLNWRPQKTLEESIKSMVNWYEKNPKGY